MDLPLRELAAELVERAGDRAEPFGLYVVASDDPAAELAREVERDVFLEFFGNSRELLAQEYGPYEPGSLFLVVVDHQRLVPAGMLRFIMPSSRGLKTLHDIERVWGDSVDDVLERTGLSFDQTRVWDVATIAVGPDYRGKATDGLISAVCLQGVIQVAHACAVQYYVTTLDMVVLRLVQDVCNRPLSNFRGLEPMRYLDSPASIPLYLDTTAYAARLRAEDPDGYQTWIEGKGFEPAMAMPDWTAVAALMRFPAARADASRRLPAG